VDIEALRQRRIDMDNVTLRSVVVVVVEPVPGGANIRVTSADGTVANAIRRMLTAHAETMDGSAGWQMTASPTASGTDMTITVDYAQVRALGFIGVMTAGMHHQAHHLDIAKGTNVHD